MAIMSERFKKAFNAFLGRDAPITYYSYGMDTNPYSRGMSITNERSIINTVYTKIAVDVSLISINHVHLNKDGRFDHLINSSLNRVLTKDANLDQTGRSLIREAVSTMLEKGVSVIFPFLTDIPTRGTDAYKVLKARVGTVVRWFPHEVLIEVYNEDTGRRQQILVEKRICSIIENPFYAIMNEYNSTMQRLIRVLNQLDRLNENNSAGKLDLIIQVPYSIGKEPKKNYAESRRKELESQMTNSQYGIGYIDGTEKIIQLNRAVENNLWEQSVDLTNQLFNQLGMSKEVFEGTADEQTMLNYQNETLEPILYALVEEIERKWISPTAESEGQAIRFFKDPFKLVPVAKLADIVDKFTRNEILTSNEIRSIMGFIPSSDPKADMLINSNLNHPDVDSSSSGEEESIEIPQKDLFD